MVVGLANNKETADKLAEWNVEKNVEERDKILEQLIESQGEKTPIEFKEIQQALEELVKETGPDIRQRTYSLFLCDAKGNQIARHKKKDTLGINFAYRTYFTGDTTDATLEDPVELEWPVAGFGFSSLAREGGIELDRIANPNPNDRRGTWVGGLR